MRNASGLRPKLAFLLGGLATIGGVAAFAVAGTAADTEHASKHVAKAADAARLNEERSVAPAAASNRTAKAPIPRKKARLVMSTPADSAIFRRSERPADKAPASFLASVQEVFGGSLDLDVPEDWRPGALRLAAGRLLVDSGDVRAYVYPTAKARACYVAVDGAGTCVHAFTPKEPVSWAQWDADGAGSEPPQVVGFAADQVTGIDVVIDGKAHAIKVKDNGFYAAAPSGSHGIDFLIVHLSDGSTVRVSLGPLDVPPPPAGESRG